MYCKQMVAISVVIPTYNRFRYVQEAIKSVQNQTFTDWECIVVNDASTQYEYNQLPSLFADDKRIQFVDLMVNSRQIYGFPCSAHVRNQGALKAQGEFICFLDDDDIWLSTKLEKQYNAVVKNKAEFSSTDGYCRVSQDEKLVYNAQMCKGVVQNKIGADKLPEWWNKELILKHNFIITSSVMVSKKLFEKIGGFRTIPNNHSEDFDCWLRCLDHVQSLYVDDILFEYDLQHGDGRNW